MARECPQVDRAVQAVAVKAGVVLEDGQMCVYVYICIHTHTYVGYIAIGLLKQGRESDFCFAKQDSSHRSEQLFSKHREGLGSENHRLAFLGRGQGLAAGPC